MFDIKFLNLRGKMKKIKTEKAVGKPLAHDIIKYGPDVKRVLFEKGHSIEESDVKELKDAGNYYVYISEEEEEAVHENEAALRMAGVACGENLSIVEPKKGRVRVLSEVPGLFKAKSSVIKEVNLRESFIFAFARNKKGVGRREEVASVKIAPLVVEEKEIKKVENILEKNKPVLQIIPPKIKRIGLIVTGTEVYEGRIEDSFEPTLKEKLSKYNLKLEESSILPDNEEKIKEKIDELAKKGLELILVTGGMAVDSEDVTPAAIKDSGAEIISRGVPIFPGNMLMVANLENSMILGIPACVLPDQKTSFDVILPRILTKEKLTKEKIGELGENGLLKNN